MAIGDLPTNKMGGVSCAAERSGSNPGNHISHSLRVLFRLLAHVLLRLSGLCLIRCLVLNHAEADMHQLFHGGSQATHFGFVCHQQALIKGLDIRVLTRRYHGREVELLPVVSTT